MSLLRARGRIQDVVDGLTREPLRDLQQAIREIERAESEIGHALGYPNQDFADLVAARQLLGEYGTGKRGGLAQAVAKIDRFMKRIAPGLT
jgi:hypothetical protein